MRMAVLLALALAGCGNGSGESGDDGDGGDDGNDNPLNQNNGEDSPVRDADDSWMGDLADGTVLDDLQFLEIGYCAPATENANFDGAHVFYELVQPEATDLYFKVTPSSVDTDVTIYGFQMDPSSTGLPPDGIGSSYACEASYDAQDNHNPGVSETILLRGYYEYRALIGIVGANGTETGEFTVEVWEEPGIDPQE